ncbi:MAG: putative endonuclease [Candidatus Krumholzibacteriia bacterium]|jgi:putative endonuclease
MVALLNKISPILVLNNMAKAHRLGEWGENTARVFLELCGYQCLDQRYRRPGGEIDLVMRKGAIVVFVEVKTRGVGAIASADEWFHPRQQRRLRKLALYWLQEFSGPAPDDLRFDLVAIDFSDEDGGASLRHLIGVA